MNKLVRGSSFFFFFFLLIVYKHNVQHFVTLLHATIANVSNPTTCYLRQMACESLRELELTYPTLLSHYVDETLSAKPSSSFPPSSSSLLRFYQEERSHISPSYAILFLTVLEHAATDEEEEERYMEGEEGDEEEGGEGGEGGMGSSEEESSEGSEEEGSGSESRGSGEGSDEFEEEEDDQATPRRTPPKHQRRTNSNVWQQPRRRMPLTPSSAAAVSSVIHFSDRRGGGGGEGEGEGEARGEQPGFSLSTVSSPSLSSSSSLLASRSMTTSLTASLGSVPVPILRQLISGLVKQIAAATKVPGYTLPVHTFALPADVSERNVLFTHWPANMLKFVRDDDNERVQLSDSRSYFDIVEKKMNKGLSSVLDGMSLMSQWSLIHIVCRMVPFATRLQLSPAIFRHHFYGFAFTQS